MQISLLPVLINGLFILTGVVLGFILNKFNFFDWLSIKGITKLPRKLESTWEEKINGKKQVFKEIIEIKKQVGTRIQGKITMESIPDMEWELEGIYNGRFLQLIWYPSKDAKANFMDFGCYFFERKGRYFEGYTVGYDSETDKIEHGPHTLTGI